MMKTYIIAEVGSVHDGSFGNAKRLIDVAAECGADMVKFQTHIASAETRKDAPMPSYFTDEPRYEYFERTAFSLEQWKALKKHCEEKGIKFISSPFSIEAVEILEKINVACYKIPSGEVTNLPLLEAVARTGKPIFLSSGMNTWAELDAAVNTILQHHDRLTVLQCTSEYPCQYEQVGLNVMLEMRERYRLAVGLSDHTLTNFSAFAGAVLGATVIEKHFTLSRHMYGSDAQHSMEPLEFAEMVRGIRAIEIMLASKVNKNDISQFAVMKQIFEKSIVAKKKITEGTIITHDMLSFKKPGDGIRADRYNEIIGRKTKAVIEIDTKITEEMLE